MNLGRIKSLDLRPILGPPVGTIINRPQPPKAPDRPNCALASDPFVGTFLILALSVGVGLVTGGYGFFPFLIWALWMGLKPFKNGSVT
jgi:hypothetical protein